MTHSRGDSASSCGYGFRLAAFRRLPGMTAMPTLPRERIDYSATVDRPPLTLPGGARIVFWTIVNLEVWDIGKPMARQVLPAPTGQPLLPDVPNWSCL